MLARSLYLSRLCLLLAVAATPLAALAQTGDHQPATTAETTISSTGSGRVDRVPDFVDVVVGIEAQDKMAVPAQAQSEGVMKAAVAAIGELGLAGQELQTGTVQLIPRYDNRPYGDEARKIVGYSAMITIRVRTTDLTSVARIIDAALGAGANRVEGVQFGIKEAIAAREEAIKLATHAAKRKAQVIAEALDLRLGRVIEATTSSAQNYGWYSANRVSNMMAQQVANEAQGPSDDQSAVVPGKVEVWAEVSVTFAGVEQR